MPQRMMGRLVLTQFMRGDINAQDVRTALMYAVLGDKPAAVGALIARGADKDVLDKV